MSPFAMPSTRCVGGSKITPAIAGARSSCTRCRIMARSYGSFPTAIAALLPARTGEEIYFHCNGVVGGDFDALEIGAEVRFVARDSESSQGPQASTVTPIGKHHLPPTETVAR